MKGYLWFFLLLVSTCFAEVNQTGPYIVRSLQKQIEVLTQENRQIKSANERLNQQLADKDREIERLQALCRKNNIDPNEYFNYRGQKRTKEWFNMMYERFSDKIVLACGKFVELRTIKPKHISNDFAEVGTIVNTDSEIGNVGYANYSYAVLSVIGNGEALINCRIESGYIANGVGHKGGGDFIFHICGYNQSLIDGASLNLQSLICVGTYKYTTALGTQKTVQSFMVWLGQSKPLTKEQFIEVINSGFELVNYAEDGGKTID